MICIIFKLKSTVPAPAQDRLLEDIHHWYSENRVGRLHVDTIDNDEYSLCYLYAPDATATDTLKRLHEINEVEYAVIPAARYAVQATD